VHVAAISTGVHGRAAMLTESTLGSGREREANADEERRACTAAQQNFQQYGTAT
jgi:hypothetical protein